MVIENREELLIVDVSQRSACLILAQESKMSEELPEPYVRRKFNDLGQNRKASRCVDGVIEVLLSFSRNRTLGEGGRSLPLAP